MNPLQYNAQDDAFTFSCPHCKDLVQVLRGDMNCQIFRHGVYRHSGQPLGPHTSEDKCRDVVNRGLVYGCAGPFRVRLTDDTTGTVETCEYI